MFRLEERTNEQKYKFWVGNICYRGSIIDENETHWIIDDDKKGRVELPKGTTVKEALEDGS